MDKIRFLNVEDGDCILLESEGKFALIDTGDTAHHPQVGDIDYGNPAISYGADMYPRVKEFLTNFLGENQKIEWILCTHCHSDHVGNVVEIVNDYDVGIVYIRPYSHDKNIKSECTNRYFDNQYQYNRIIDNVSAEKICPNIPKSIDLGNIQITNYYDDIVPLEDENMQSIVSLIEMNGEKIGLMGDIQNSPTAGTTEIEQNIAEKLGKLDVLKLGHHGLNYSNSLDLLRITDPTISVNSGRLEYLQANKYNPLSFFADKSKVLLNTVNFNYIEL